MSEIFQRHIDRDAYEAKLRADFLELAGIKPDALSAPAACQMRGREVSIQFALWLADEMNRGTPASDLAEGACRLLGDIVGNLAATFAPEPGEDVIAGIFDRMRWQLEDGAGDVVVTTERPEIDGGRA